MKPFAVSEEKNRKLLELMAAVGMREEDIEERFIRSSGAGGQHVNKSATCVQLKHLPTGIEVKCMRDRSQSINRFLARRELAEKLAEKAGIATSRSSEQDKLRRRKASRNRKSRQKYAPPEASPDDKH
ncbi:peptide chain release factor-like protein [Geobacter pelophilus]|uniref:Peptide chain release factor-like protein n=1 Tax=Geoanaerobacter pelophilus TaxID=60036 RepID=A0AAW4L3W3_9BACT|nr:peptide chain release factor-like protein [Geoanaerobacter pelophilus]MBT0665429.1 peptide chain release factor-like protein [Geoanaerobacter pelophilus]